MVTRPVSPRRAEGRFGRALDFDGQRDVTVIEKPGFRDEAGTLEAWVWLPAEKQPACHGTILRLDGVSPWTYHILQRDMNTSRISYTTYDGQDGHGLAIEEAFSNPKSYPIEIQRSDAHQHQTKELAWGSLGTKERMARFGQLMAQAKAAARTPQEKERVALFEQGQWEYMRKGQP